MRMRLISKVITLANINNGLIKNSVSRSFLCGCHQSFYSSRSPNQPIKTVVDPVTGEEKKVKTKIIPKITLITGNELSVTTLEEAQKLSKRRDLKLVKIIDLDTKTERPVYKLMTGAEYHAEDLKQREHKKKEREKGGIKGEKLLILNQNISEHDLQTDVRKIIRWITKSYEVRVVINGDGNNMDKAEQVYKFLENALKSQVRFLQIRQKGSDIKFQICPPKKENDGGEKSL